MATKLDTTLASNLATAVVPRPDIMIGHGIKYWAQQIKQTGVDILNRLKGRHPTQDPYPPRGALPGNTQAIGSPHAPGTGGSALRTLKCAESGRLHEALPLEKAPEIADYHSIADLSFSPARRAGRLGGGEAGVGQAPVQDAFRTHVTVNGTARSILPDTLLRSSLLNARLGTEVGKTFARGETLAAVTARRDQLVAEREALLESMKSLAKRPDGGSESSSAAQWKAAQASIVELSKQIAQLNNSLPLHEIAAGSAHGEVQHRFPNTLYDPLTGFAASIAVRNGNEVVIGFSGVGSQGGSIAQVTRGVMNALGLSPPKNLAQASKLTQMVKAHLDALNAELPPERQFKLKLAGFSMGGGMATYAALRNGVEAVAISPMRLGLLARAKCGREAIKHAPKLVTEVTVEGDWVANNAKTRGLKLLSVPSYILTGRRADPLGAIGFRYLIPKPSADDRVLVAESREWSPKDVDDIRRSIDVHADFSLCLEVYRQRMEAELPEPETAEQDLPNFRG